MFFNGWTSLLRVLLVGVPAYFTLLLLLRIGGKRTLSKFNAFDLVVTVAFGSTLASGLLSPELSLVEVIAAFTLLVLLQFVVTWSAVRWPFADRLVKADPQLLYHGGEYLHSVMKRERVTRGELLAAVRSKGYAGIEDVIAIVLETDGTISVVAEAATAESALRNVQGARD